MEDDIKLPLTEKLKEFDKTLCEYVREYNKLALTLNKTNGTQDPLKIKKIKSMQLDFYNCEEIILTMHPELKDNLGDILKNLKCFMVTFSEIINKLLDLPINEEFSEKIKKLFTETFDPISDEDEEFSEKIKKLFTETFDPISD